MKLSCAVAADLLPLYAEKMTSAETNALVEEHLRECPACRKRLEELQAPAVMPVDADAMPLKKLQRAVRRKRRAAVWAAVLLSLAVAVAVFGMLSAPHYLSYDHAVRVTEREDGLVEIDATIYCEKDSHKGIIIGKHGSMLKKIGEQARLDMEQFLDTKVFLQTWVKVKENWRDSQTQLKNFGFKNE